MREEAVFVFRVQQAASPASGPVKSYELLHRITGEGLSVSYCFSRRPFSHDPHMVSVQMQFTNSGDTEARNLRIQEPKLQSGMRIAEFPEIGQEWQPCPFIPHLCFCTDTLYRQKYWDTPLNSGHWCIKSST